MKIVLENVQGFKGLFEFEVIEGLNNITAKLNGTGKTTFYECLKLMTNPAIFTKEDLIFMVNKESEYCRFLVYLEDVIYGFAYDRKNLVYLRKYADDEPEYRNAPFEEIGKQIGVFLLNDTFINICDKYINLLSDSSTNLNFELIDALLSHKKLEELIAFTLEANALRTNKLKTDKIQYASLKNQLDNMMFYRNIDTFRSLLEDDAYIDVHDAAVHLLTWVSNYALTADSVELLPIDVLFGLMTSIADYTVLIDEIDKSSMDDISCVFGLKGGIAEYLIVAPPLELSEFELLAELKEEIKNYSVQCVDRTLNIATNLLQAVYSYAVTKPLEIDWSVLTILKLINDVNEYVSNCRIMCECQKEAEAIAETLSNYKVNCPIRKEVYLVGGECVSV